MTFDPDCRYAEWALVERESERDDLEDELRKRMNHVIPMGYRDAVRWINKPRMAGWIYDPADVRDFA